MGILDSFGSFKVVVPSIFVSCDPPQLWFRHTNIFRQRLPILRFAVTPFPVADFRQILAMFINVMLVLDEFVPHLLLQVGTLGT
jgi:hypothetical protein